MSTRTSSGHPMLQGTLYLTHLVLLGISQGTQTASLPMSWDTSMSSGTSQCETPHTPSCSAEQKLYSEELDRQDRAFQIVKQVPCNLAFTPVLIFTSQSRPPVCKMAEGLLLTSTATSSLRLALCKMRDHRSNSVLRITPLKLMDLLWSLISELSSANLVSVGKKNI